MQHFGRFIAAWWRNKINDSAYFFNQSMIYVTHIADSNRPISCISPVRCSCIYTVRVLLGASS